MSIEQIGMILEIVGFLLVALFAGILLEKGVFGIWAGKGESLFFSLAKILDKFTFSWSREDWASFTIGMPGEQRLSSLRLGTFGSILLSTIEFSLPLVAITCVIIGWLKNMPLLFWIGVGIFVLAFSISLVRYYREEYLGESWKDIWVPPSLSLITMLFVSLFSPLLIALCFSLAILRTLQMIATLLAGRDSLKKALIIVGSIMVLTGLVLEFISTM